MRHQTLFALLLCGCTLHCGYRDWIKIDNATISYQFGSSHLLRSDMRLSSDAFLRSQWLTCEVFEHRGNSPYHLAVYFDAAPRLLPGMQIEPHRPFAIRVAPFPVDVFLVGTTHKVVPPLIPHGRMTCQEARIKFGPLLKII